jgi:uncharacterized protein YabE (DUF348 family)
MLRSLSVCSCLVELKEVDKVAAQRQLISKLSKLGKVQIFRNDTKKSHMQAQINQEPIKFGESQLQMGSKFIVFSFAT